MKDKAVIFITSSDFSSPSAFLFRLLAIARGLIENEVFVYWFILGSEPIDEIANDPFYKYIKFVRIGKPNKLIKRSRIAFYLYLRILELRLQPYMNNITEHFNNIVCFTVGNDFLHLFNIITLCKKNGIRVFHERTEYPLLNKKSLRQKFNVQLYLKYIVPKFDHIFVISNALKLFFENELKNNNKSIPVTLLNMIVEPDRYSCSCPSIDSQYKDIVYVGTMYGDKDGVYYLLEAFLKIYQDYPDSRLILIGDNTRVLQMQRVNNILSKMPYSDRIIFTGQLDRKSVIEKINSAYCLVLARPNNIQAKYGFPTKLGEYLSTGKPIVITSVGEIPLYLKDGMNAYIAKPDDVNSFADKLRECLNDPKKASLIGKKGQELVYKEFNYCECTKIIVRSI